MEKANDIFPVKDEPQIDWVSEHYFIKIIIPITLLIIAKQITGFKQNQRQFEAAFA